MIDAMQVMADQLDTVTSELESTKKTVSELMARIEKLELKVQ
jgi:hypothetical protein